MSAQHGRRRVTADGRVFGALCGVVVGAVIAAIGLAAAQAAVYGHSWEPIAGVLWATGGAFFWAGASFPRRRSGRLRQVLVEFVATLAAAVVLLAIANAFVDGFALPGLWAISVGAAVAVIWDWRTR